MKTVLRISVFALLAMSLFAAQKEPQWTNGKVIVQNIGSAPVGSYAGPLGNGAIAVPLYRPFNWITIETHGHQYVWREICKHPLVVPVN